ncbi:SLC13 family permease [Paraglaciecola aquimarina]|uniref:SLC13 family permease n=1 Tax=Paraglaciecola algarum TaxID=3050085 RepID=A0ABS9DAT5_9ALTE|nr:SLC13 family permease [Paraglaciecola sp. G1-23]MCF2948909.1 SLC13 family permease [Paraglaciecola sp. G1-23]
MQANTKLILLSAISAIGLYLVLSFYGNNQAVSATAAITLFTAMLWVTEAIPIPVTSLIPFLAFPMAGVISHKEAASALGSHVIILLMGAFMLSKALEKSNVHSRLAYYLVNITGGKSAKRLVLGFMLTAAILSMWISNSATTLMLLPITLAVLQHVKDPKLTIAMLLGIAYAASLGGVGTPVGTPPNIIFMSVYVETQGKGISFVEWMKTGVPIVVIGIPIIAWWLTRGLENTQEYVLPKSGQWQPAEKRVLSVFLLVALAWMTRPYWTQWLNLTSIGDSTIALTGVVLMFMIPNGNKPEVVDTSDEKFGESAKKADSNKLLDWQTAVSIPWGMLLLFAGGICIAKAFAASGLSSQMGDALSGLSSLPVPLLILSICLFVTFLTEITSNTATATLLMPILAAAGMAAGIDPALIMMPAAISASCAFMLPVATAPNAIVYGMDKFSIKTMAREGFALNVIIAFVVTGVSYLTL